MPNSLEEATAHGVRRGWRNFLSSLGTHLGKVFAYGLLVLVFVLAVAWMWDNVMSPFRTVGSWFSGGWETATSWWPFDGDDAADASPDAAVPAEPLPQVEVSEEVGGKPGAICSRTGGWNPFCD